MGFASEYLSDRVLFETFITEPPNRNLALVITIPAYNEPEIIKTIDSLASCYKPDCEVEVLVHINAAPSAGSEELDTNINTITQLENRKKDADLPFRLFIFNTGQPGIKGWGAGTARKVVMDEAVRRFDLIDRPEGLIVSLDADCMVEKNYLMALYHDFYKLKDRSACSIYFEHPLSGKEFDTDHYKAIADYELHLRYYYQALRYTGYPFVYHTVGSAFAVRASYYTRSGGMNRQQAGEDFYFIQKVIPMGGYFYLNNTTVKPSPRISERVPFGTGPAIMKMIESGEGMYKTYNPVAFSSLRELFIKVESLYNYGQGKDPGTVTGNLDVSTRDFLDREDWKNRINEIKANTASLQSFSKRFFAWFNMFKVVKYLNWVHAYRDLDKIEVTKAASEMLRLSGLNHNCTRTEDLLNFYRDMER